MKDLLFEQLSNITRKEVEKYRKQVDIQARMTLNINRTIDAEPFNCVFSIDGEGEQDICVLADEENNLCPYFDHTHTSNCLCPLDSGNILIRRTNERES